MVVHVKCSYKLEVANKVQGYSFQAILLDLHIYTRQEGRQKGVLGQGGNKSLTRISRLSGAYTAVV